MPEEEKSAGQMSANTESACRGTVLTHIIALFLFVLPFMLYSFTVSAYEANASRLSKKMAAISCSPAATNEQNKLPGNTDKAGCHVGMLMITCGSCRETKK